MSGSIIIIEQSRAVELLVECDRKHELLTRSPSVSRKKSTWDEDITRNITHDHDYSNAEYSSATSVSFRTGRLDRSGVKVVIAIRKIIDRYTPHLTDQCCKILILLRWEKQSWEEMVMGTFPFYVLQLRTMTTFYTPIECLVKVTVVMGYSTSIFDWKSLNRLPFMFKILQ